MNLNISSESNYLKIDFKNKIQLLNDMDKKEEMSELEILSKYFEKPLPLEELNSFIYKLIDKNTNDSFKYNKDLIKQYKKEYPFTEQASYESVKRILSSNFSPNFAFNKTNIEDISRVLYYAYKNMKKYGINNEEKLKAKLNNINLEEKDLINMYIDFDLIRNDKWEKIVKKRKQLRNKLYANKNPNSTGNLAVINELYQEENNENKKDGLTVKNNKTNDTINSSGSDSDNLSEGVKKIFSKIKGIFSSSEKDKKIEKDKNIYNSDINDIDEIDNNGEPIPLIKDYFIYPEKNTNINIKLELPIEFIILIKKLENVKILTFQIRNISKKMVKENIVILSNLSLLFPKVTEIKVDLNDEKLSGKLNKIYQMRHEELLRQNKLNYKIFKYRKNYQVRTENCWIPEGDIILSDESDNDKRTSTNKEKKSYLLEENVFENSNNYENKLNSIDENNYPNLKYIFPFGQKTFSYPRKEYIEIDELEESEENESRGTVYSEFNKKITPALSPEKRKSTVNSLNNLRLKEIAPNKKNLEIITYIEQSKKKGTPHLLFSFVKRKKEPFAMILLYSWFLEKINNIKSLSLYFNDGFSLETEFYLKSENITFEGFNFLSFCNQLRELNEINISFNSIDSSSFQKILGIINSNKNVSILRINFFPPNVNFEVTSLLKLCSLMKFSLHYLYREQKISFRKERDIKDLELDYFLLNHKFDISFEKNIGSLFNVIKNNINKYKEIIFRFDLPILLLSCDKYIIIIIKFLINVISLIMNSKNELNIFKIISPELILDGRITPFLHFYFQNLNKFNGNNHLTEIILKCKIYRLPDLFNICLYNNINNIKLISIGDMDFESFSGFINLYNSNIHKMNNLKILKIGLNNSVISFNEKVSEKINEFIIKSPINLEQKILFSFLFMNNDITKLENLMKNVQKANINKLVIQIGHNNNNLLNKIFRKQKKELELLFIIMTQGKYKLLMKEKIIKYINKFFSRHKEKIVICKPFFSSNEL